MRVRLVISFLCGLSIAIGMLISGPSLSLSYWVHSILVWVGVWGFLGLIVESDAWFMLTEEQFRQELEYQITIRRFADEMTKALEIEMKNQESETMDGSSKD